MSSPSYYSEYEYEYDYEQFDENDQATFEEQEPYMTYDEEMEAFEDLDNSIFEENGDIYEY